MNNMNLKTLILAVAAFTAAGTALADAPHPADFQTAAASKTRAEVRAEVEEAYARGELAHVRAPGVEFTNVASNKTRDEVRGEAIQAAKAKASQNVN